MTYRDFEIPYRVERQGIESCENFLYECLRGIPKEDLIRWELVQKPEMLGRTLRVYIREVGIWHWNEEIISGL